MALSASDTDKYPRAMAYVDASGNPVLVSGAAPLPTGTFNTRAVVAVTLTLDTSAYANGDLLAATQVVDAVFRAADGTGVIEAIQVLDADDQTLYSFVVYFLSSNVSMGTENSAPAPADADAATILGFVAFATTDGVDLANSKLYYKGGLSIPVKAISGTDDLAIAVVIGTGTPTHTASGVTMRLFIRQD